MSSHAHNAHVRVCLGWVGCWVLRALVFGAGPWQLAQPANTDAHHAPAIIPIRYMSEPRSYDRSVTKRMAVPLTVFSVKRGSVARQGRLYTRAGTAVSTYNRRTCCMCSTHADRHHPASSVFDHQDEHSPLDRLLSTSPVSCNNINQHLVPAGGAGLDPSASSRPSRCKSCFALNLPTTHAHHEG